RLGDFKEASQWFEKITQDSKWGRLALYNLGIIAEKSGHEELAFGYYLRAYRESVTEKEQLLASLKVKRLRERLETREDKTWYGVVSLGAGYDDNVGLFETVPGEVTGKESDGYREVIGSVSRYINGNRDAGMHFGAGLYQRSYLDLDAFDYTSYFLRINREQKVGGWRLLGGVRAEISEIEGEDFLNSLILGFRGRTGAGKVHYELGMDYSHVKGDAPYDHLTGYSWSVDLSAIWLAKEGYWRLGLTHEKNRREDYYLAGEFQSYSPARSTLVLKNTKTLAPGMELVTRFSLREGNYDDSNVYLNTDGTTRIKDRDEVRMAASIRLQYLISQSAIGTGWFIFAVFNYADNDAEFDQYSYTNRQLTLGVERLF
ncbi:MAG: hypothetical protein OEZ23_04230, partial [Gammaproteobacteria bacterium]|nr:hypothetical protein [Gammaproteobacteria bacterium]